MQTYLRGRDMITTQEWTKEEIDTVMDVAMDLKRKRALGQPHAYLRDKVLTMLFFFSSTRTRSSFEAGGGPIGRSWHVFGQFVHPDFPWRRDKGNRRNPGPLPPDGLAIRHCDWGVGTQYLRWAAEACRVPVLNMQCETYHPFQILADLQTIIEKKGDPKGKTITVSWAYAASYQKPMSVPQSLILLMTRYGMNMRLVHPPEFKLMPDIVEQAQENARKHHGSLEVMDDFEAGMKGSDIVYAKSWGRHEYHHR